MSAALTGFHMIPLSELRPMPGAVPSTVRDRRQIAELAASIRAHGILVPLLVRAARNSYVLQRGRLASRPGVFGWFVIDTSLSGRGRRYRSDRQPAFFATRKAAEAALPAEVPWEVVKGLGRLTAAKAASVRLAPCVVRDMDDVAAEILRARS